MCKTRIWKGFVPVSLDIGNGLLMLCRVLRGRVLLWGGTGMRWTYRPWCLLGDFNAALFLDDFAVGSLNINISMREFKACVENIEVLYVQQAGLKFTWNQKPKGKDGIFFWKIEESLNVTFDETPPPSKTSPLVDDDLDEEEAIREIEKKNIENIVEDETLEIDEIVNINRLLGNSPLENCL
ncbi:retrovirus-related pol polyprotein from transposon TNT 1-94 [Tanacetum coccineum]